MKHLKNRVIFTFEKKKELERNNLNKTITKNQKSYLRSLEVIHLRIGKLLIIVIAVLLFSSSTLAWSNWQTLKTEYFTVFYQPEHEAEARQVLATLEHYRPEVEKLCGNQAFNFPVIIDDTGILVNGFSDPVYSYAHLFRRQPGVWAGTENWWSLVGVHEYTHQLSLSKTGGAAKVIGAIFGNNFMFMPNLLTPGWIAEGITVYSESQHSSYQGRLNDGLFDAQMGAMIADDKFPAILEATYSPFENPSGNNIYLYGGEFFQYLSNTYGEDKFARFFEVNGSSVCGVIPPLNLFIPALTFDRSAEQVYGKPFTELWEEWREFEGERFKDYRMEGDRITDCGWSVNSPQIFAGKLYYQHSYLKKTNAFNGFSFAKIIEKDLATGEERTMVSTTSDFATPFKIKGNKLYYTTYDAKTGYANASLGSIGYYTVLHRKDLATGRDKVLLKTDLRSFEVLEDGKIIYTKDKEKTFGSEVYLLDPGTKKATQLFETNYLIEEIAVSGEKTVVVARKDWEGFSIYALNLNTAEFTPIVHTPYQEFGVSLQGDRVFFTANYEKKVSSYCYDFNTAQIHRLTANGLAAYAVYDPATNHLYYLGLNSGGYDIYHQEANFAEYELPDSPATAPPVFSLTDDQITRGGYWDNLKTLGIRFWMPLVNSDTQQYGVYFEGGDAVMDFPYYAGSVGYDYKKEEYFGSFNLAVNFFAPLQVGLSYLDEDDERTGGISLAYPLINGLEPGFSNLTIGTSFNYDPDYDGMEYEPFVITGLRFPTTKIDLRISAPESELKNGVERAAVYGELTLKQYLPQSELMLKGLYIDDPDNPDEVFTEIRGYDDELTAKKGMIYTLEFSKPIFQIRKGCWNPNFYLEDVILTLFGDQAVPNEGIKQSSWGMELHCETRLVYDYLPLDLGYRFVRNDSGENIHELFLKSM